MTAGALQKVPTGIAGFDEISGGGLPRGRTTLLVGGPGSGKTVFALNMLVNGARQFGEPGIFIAFEENTEQLMANAASFGWELPELVDKQLVFIDARLSSDMAKTGGFDIQGLLSGLEARAKLMAAAAASDGRANPVRIVFDSVDVLLAHLEDPRAEKEEVYRIHEWLARNHYTGIITTKEHFFGSSPQVNTLALQYMADCVIKLDRQVNEGVSHRTLTIVKYRGSSFAENEFNVVIGPRGMQVPSLSIFDLSYPVASDRVSSGVAALDEMLTGGYLRGSSALITGSPGTAKSTLAGAFVDAACRRGEQSLYISYDEGPEEITRNLSSVGLRLRPHIEAGLLRMYASRAEARGAAEHLVLVQAMVREHHPTCIVIDPLSAMVKAGGTGVAKAMAQRLIYEAKAAGITMLLTSLLAEDDPSVEATPLEISTIADTWIHLSYVVLAGERNRALTIIKARGTAHSNQVRELILSHHGIDLSEVYTAGGEVLMGTLRYEMEAREQSAARRRAAEAERLKRALEQRRAEAAARMEALRREIESADSELEQMINDSTRELEQQRGQWAEVHRRRAGSSQDEESAE